ncbi:GNAT family N-acetyltransferase [Streptomyces xanthophaeus]|uniref:Acetyltransferase n=1 Tax=Streptomyces xanthophaeus TaxID=67385 RepID=A0A919LDG3_9ACTN|nr:GNAT family N-acetyltransferase [Streptomyces xanthophaeus]WST24962.1 GNAT family N-acetyltransferase [Streptomyces xanthophaeus]WST60065.1 GNAT family N-acetyltransferase [Streptomyces xanthophaeus]GHI87080.1 acetyltransferase [Streptomyces xanthophaeus]
MLPIPGGDGPARPAGLQIGPLDLAGRVDEALRVQAVAFGLSEEEVGIRRYIVQRHMACGGARALGAFTEDGTLTGFVYGMPNDRTYWWSTIVEPYLRAGGHEGWLEGSFVITELHVHPGFQGHGVGRALITRITDGAAEPRSILSAIDTDSPARRLYRALGYSDLARRVHFPSASLPYAVMGAPLPLRRP